LAAGGARVKPRLLDDPTWQVGRTDGCPSNPRLLLIVFSPAQLVFGSATKAELENVSNPFTKRRICMGWFTRSNTAYNDPWIVDNHACWKAFNQIKADKCFILFTLAACSDHRLC
jgi:hypothetical protein